MPGIKNVNLFNVRSGYIKGEKDLHVDDVDHDRQYCQACLSYGIRSKLKRRMYKVEVVVDSATESKPKLVPAIVPDGDRFRQCYHCGDIVPLYNVKYESKIEDFVDTIDNPFDSNPGNMQGFTPGGDRLKLSKSKSIYKRKKQYAESINDPDIKKDILKGNQVTIHQR